HTSELSVFHPRFHFTAMDGLKNVGSNIVYAFQLLFGSCPNQNEQLPPITGDSFLDFYVPLFGVLGLGVLGTRINWLKISTLLFFCVGLVPFIMTPGPHTARLLGCVVPAFLVCAWGICRFWQAAAATKWLGGAKGANLLLAVFGFWAFFTSFSLSKQWVENKWEDPLSADIVQDSLSRDRVYLVRYAPAHFIDNAQDLLCEGKDVHLANAANPLDLAEGEKGKDLGVITWVQDKDTQDRLQREFPGIAWHDKLDQNHTIVLRWTEIPFGELSESPADFFYIHPVTGAPWTRRFYSNYGLGRGLILDEDRSSRWSEALPPCAQGDHCGRVAGTWEVKASGTYGLELRTGNPTQLFIDGRKVLGVGDHGGFKTEDTSLDLAAGNHLVEEVTVFGGVIQFPPVLVQSKSEGWNRPLDELAGAPETGPHGP
ncbi:MAG TPA: hypothetical protein VK859_05000, partial [bacterium]|nr:hypothetical protein [bacterium]